MPPDENETPGQSMKRIEAEVRGISNAQRGLENYSANIGAQRGPLSGMVMTSGDTINGAPQSYGVRGALGPVSFTHTQPSAPVAPTRTVGINVPFNADAYFGVNAAQTPSGRQYGVEAGTPLPAPRTAGGTPYEGAQGSINAYGQYNPTRRDLNAGFEMRRNFSDGGRAVVGHESASGIPVSLEEHKGEMRHRAHSGDSRMAADYGYITNAHKDADGMKTDAYVGPHHDSDKVFVINQKHPHTGRFNEHKVMLGYKDRSHAVHDYVHSFNDGLGHKRVQSIVEMGKHELKDWLKNGPHTRPVHMAEGGEYEAPPLTIHRKAAPMTAPVADVEQPMPAPKRPIDYADLMETMEAAQKLAAPTPNVTARNLASTLQPPEDQGAVSPTFQGVQEGLESAGRGAVKVPGTIAQYIKDTSEKPDPSARLGEDIGAFGKQMLHSAAEDPAGFIGGALPIIGNMLAGADIAKIKDMAIKAREDGDEETASKMDQIASVAAASIILPGAAGVVSKAALKEAERTAVKAAVKDLTKTATKTVEEAEPAAAAKLLPTDEHSMNVERQDRVIMAPEDVTLTKDEQKIIKSFKKPEQRAQIEDSIRKTKARYPESDGWSPMRAAGAEFDEAGLPVINWAEQTYGFNKADTDIIRPVLDKKTGKPKKEPKLDANGKIVRNEDGDIVYSNKNVTKVETQERPLKKGTPEYDQHLGGAVQNGYEEIMDVVSRAEKGDEAAKVMLRQLGWYREFMKKGFDERGGAYPGFSDLLGATSPNTAVDQNYRYAVDAQRRFARGDFDAQAQAARDYKRTGASLADFPEEDLIRRNDAFDPKTGVAKQYGMNSRNAQMAMADLWREKTPGQAPKARNFSGNLGGATDAATIDVWAARHANRMAGRDRLPPPVEKGVQGKLGQDLTPGGEFGFGQDYFQNLSDRLNKSNELKPYLEELGYDKVTPMDLQALAWFMEKEHWTKNNWTTKSGEGGSFEQEMTKYPSNRWQAGFSITQDAAPSDAATAVTRRVIENTVRNDKDVMVHRVQPTYGRYGGADERSFDIELTAKPGWDPSKWMESIIEEAKANNQKDVFFSRRLSPEDALNNPNARPGVEIYFQDAAQMHDILPILEQFTQRGQDGFTFTTGLRLQDRLAGGSDVAKTGFVPDYVGVRLQYVPEIKMRFDDKFRNAALNDPMALHADMQGASARMLQAVDAIANNQKGVKVVDARMHNYDTLVVGKESYDQFLQGIKNPAKSAGEYEATATAVDPKRRFGQSIFSHVEGRDRALGKGTEERPADASGAVERSNGEVKLAKGGAVEEKKGDLDDLLFDVAHRAARKNMNVRQLSMLIKLATGADANWSHNLAGHLVSGNVTAIRLHSERYPKIVKAISRLDAMLGGSKWHGVVDDHPLEGARVDHDMIKTAIDSGGTTDAVKHALRVLLEGSDHG
jgi:hypothetical protein